MAISNLTGQKTYQSFRNLMQISSSGQVYDGLGNLVTFLQLTSSFASGSSGGTGAGFPFSGSAVITGSLLVSGSIQATQGFSGSFSGSGANLSSIPASAITGLNLSQIATGSVTASVTPTQFSVVSGSTTEFRVTGTGVTIGSVITDTHTVTGSLNISGSLTATRFTGSLFGTSSWAQNSISSSFPLTVVGSSLVSTYVVGGTNASTIASIFIGSGSGFQAASANNSNFIGLNAGRFATNASQSNFIGSTAGQSAAFASNSNFFGSGSGFQASFAASSNFFGSGSGFNASSANNSNFLGENAGRSAAGAYGSNFIGQNAGRDATDARNSNFFGNQAGRFATNAYNSNFIGNTAGYDATSAFGSNFLGIQAGLGAYSASYSTLIGFRAGSPFLVTTSTYVPSIGSNNIIIGTNITLESGRKDSINLGAIIFATGSYSEVETNVFSGSLGTGRVGINNPNPNYTLDVSGSVNFTGDIYQNGTLFELRDKYMWYNIRIDASILKYNLSATVNPNQTLADLNSLLPYVYVDIIDQFNTITYTSLTFTTVSDIIDFITNNSINFGHAIIYSIKNNTGNLRVGGVNLFSTQIGPRGKLGKVSSKRIYDVNTAGSVYSTLTQTLIDTLVDECSNIVPNFSANYINQDQVEAIVAGADPNTPFTYFRFAPINKYKKRQFSRHYVGQTVQGIDVNGNIVTVSNSYQVKVLGVAVYEWYNNNLYFRSFITNYGYSSQSRQELGPQNTGGSMLNVYIVQTSDNCRALVIEPIGIDRIVVPSSFDKISDNDKLNEPELTIYRKGNATEVASYQNRKDVLSIFTFLTPANSFSHLREKPIHEVDIINLYSDRTCDLFEKAIKLDRLKYTPKKHINLILLNSNYQKN